MSSRVGGFRFSGIHCGIKANGRSDLALIAADEPAAAAGVFTKNLVRAAPVDLSERRLRKGWCQAVLVNSGNANACTGEQGRRAALSTTKRVAEALGSSASLVVPASTGVIGVKLPEEPIERASSALVDGLSPRNASDFAEAILTTDRGPKLVSAQLTVGRTKCRMLGIAKGAGMIHPNMATTLAFVATDAQIRPAALRRILARATEATFNRASVDGDTSTNDSIYALASGQASNACIEAKGSAADRFEAALTEVLESLAKMIVADGEGAEHLVRVRVSGARTDADAVQIARTIATSQLVKTAIHGCDPNWGRILAAAGRSGVRFKPGQVSVQIDRVPIFRDGEPIMTARTEARASRAMLRAEYDVEVRVGAGKGSGHYWTCDLGHEYVRINADYRS